jgi:hypothetical protein
LIFKSFASNRLVYLLAYPAVNAVESVVDNYIRDTVDEPALGSVLYCDLFLGYAEHSGIYVGNNEVIHLNRKGDVERVTVKRFIKSTTARSIYVSCIGTETIGGEEIAQRAIDACDYSEQRNYNFILDNCHQFSSSCLTGDTENSDNFLWMLKHTANNELSVSHWRVWKS